MTDDHAVQAISAYGSNINKTPNIDRLAKQGGVFEESFCCNSVCTPSRAAILTGKHSFQNGVLTLGHVFDGSQVTLQQLLQEGGYQTAVYGKWHLHSEPTCFDSWKVFDGCGQGAYYNPTFATPSGTVREEGYSTDIVTTDFLNWIKTERDEKKPFFACCHFKAPHRPWLPHPRFFDLYKDETIPRPGTFFDDYADRCDVLKDAKMQICKDLYWGADLKVTDPGPNKHRLGISSWSNGGLFELERFTDEQRDVYVKFVDKRNSESGIADREFSDKEFSEFVYQRFIKDYLRCIAAVDENVGRIIDYVDDAGLAEDTIVVYCSDQGFYLGEHGWFDKRWMFEESFQMPLLMRWPGRITPGTRYTEMVQNIDYAPTFLEAAGLSIPDAMHGTSMLKVIDDGAAIHNDLYYHYYQHLGEHHIPQHDGVRTKEYKLIHFYSEGEFNLFDLSQDPNEMRSVHDDPAYATVLTEMTERYWQARERFQVPDQYGPNAYETIQ